MLCFWKSRVGCHHQMMLPMLTYLLCSGTDNADLQRVWATGRILDILKLIRVVVVFLPDLDMSMRRSMYR